MGAPPAESLDFAPARSIFSAWAEIKITISLKNKQVK
jgi:hypothetical protein